jgi:hypothetical protein
VGVSDVVRREVAATMAHLFTSKPEAHLALEALVGQRERGRVTALLAFARLLTEAAAEPSSTFWPSAPIRVEMRRLGGDAVSFSVRAEGEACEALLAADFRGLSFDALSDVVQCYPALVGPGFIYVEDDVVSVSSVTFLEVEVGLDEAWETSTFAELAVPLPSDPDATAASGWGAAAAVFTPPPCGAAGASRRTG